MTSAIASTQARVPRSTSVRTSSSLRRSDSKTSRKASPSASMKSKYAPTAPSTRSWLSAVPDIAWPHPVGQLGDLQLQEGEVELPLAREVLVEHRLADPGAVGDLVHGRGVEALRHEDLLRRLEQLEAPRAPREARGAAGRGG